MRPDLSGWRRDKYASLPKTTKGTITAIPDWVAEVLSPTTQSRDWKDKRRIYHQFQVPYYWLIDWSSQTVTNLTWTDADYVVSGVFGKGDVIKAVPFEQAQFSVEELFDLE